MMKPTISANSALWLLLSVLSAGSMGWYVLKIWSANQPHQFSDLYASWWAAHELFLHGRNPYTPEVAHEIQTVIYGAPVAASDPSAENQMVGGFAYPLYAAFLLWPTVYIPFSTLQSQFFWLSALMTLASVVAWIRALGFRPHPLLRLMIAVFTLGSFPVLEGLRLQNLSLVAAAFLTATLILLSNSHLVLAGIFLAASTFKPQFTVLLIPWLVFWVLSDWRHRRRLGWSFLTTMILLVGGSEWLLPGWIRHFLQIAYAYTRYTFGRSLLDLWFTRTGGPFTAAALVLAAFTFCWPYRRYSASSPGFIFATSLILAATIVAIPTLAPHAQVLLLPGFLCLLGHRHFLWRSGVPARLLLIATWILLAWSWLAAAVLALAAIWAPLERLFRFWQVPLYTSPLVPFVLALSLASYIRTRLLSHDLKIQPRDL